MHIKLTSDFKQYREGLIVTRKLPIGDVHYHDNIRRNIYFVRDCIVAVAFMTLLTWLGIFLLMSDVHSNQGQTSTSSHSSTSSASNDSFSFLNTLNLSKHLSYVQYNMQSIMHKLDILSTELLNFDIPALSKTWLHSNIQTTDLLIPDFRAPVRKVRIDMVV